jgi:hypothetical protein
MREGHRVSLFATQAAPLHTGTNRMAVLDWFAALGSDPIPGADVVAAAGRAAGSGGIVLWLSTVAAPADLVAAVRRSGVALVRVGAKGHR